MKLKKWQNASTEDRKRKKKVHSLPNKNQDWSELILIEIQSFQIEKAPNGGPYQDTQVTISGRSLKVPYYMKLWRHFNLAIFLKIQKLKCTKIVSLN